MNLSNQGIEIGLFTFSYYGLLVVLAVILSMLFAYRRIKARKLETQHVWALTAVILITSIIGARLWYINFPPPSAIRVGLTADFYRSNMLEILALWQGGFAMPGAIFGSLIGLLLYTWQNKLPLMDWLRAIIPIVPFSTSIIIWGNFLTHQNYGLPAAIPWAIEIEPLYRVPGYTSIATYHPLFLYQSLWAIFTTLVVILNERKTHNDQRSVPLTGSMLAFGFLMLETIRIDAGSASTMNMAFWTVILLFSLMRFYFLPRQTIAEL